VTETLVSDIMHRGVVTCGPRTSLRDVARIMVTNDVRKVVVCTDSEAGMYGVISDWLLAQARGADLDNLVATDIILPFTSTVSADSSLGEATELLRRNRVSDLVVVAPGEEGNSDLPVGTVSCFDIIREMADAGAGLPSMPTMQTAFSGVGYPQPSGC
jgi:CBS domain-containing protein